MEFSREESDFLADAIYDFCIDEDGFEVGRVPSKELLDKLGITFRHSVYDKYRTIEEKMILDAESKAQRELAEQDKLAYESVMFAEHGPDWRGKLYIRTVTETIEKMRKGS